MNIKEQANTIYIIIGVIGWTLALTEYSKTTRLQKQIDQLPPKHLLKKVDETHKLLIEHLKIDKCLK